MEVDRRAFIASLGGVAAVNLMDHEAKAEALEHYMEDKLDEMVAAQQPEKFPTVAEIEAQIDTRPYRRGAGSVFTGQRGENVKMLEPMPDEADAPGLLPPPLRAGQPRAAKRDARDEDRHVRRDHPRVPAPRLRALAHQAGSRLVGRAALRALHSGEERVRDPLSPDAALLSRTTTRVTSTRISTTGSSGTTISRRSTSPTPTRCSRTTSGTWSRAW